MPSQLSLLFVCAVLLHVHGLRVHDEEVEKKIAEVVQEGGQWAYSEVCSKCYCPHELRRRILPFQAAVWTKLECQQNCSGRDDCSFVDYYTSGSCFSCDPSKYNELWVTHEDNTKWPQTNERGNSVIYAKKKCDAFVNDCNSCTYDGTCTTCKKGYSLEQDGTCECDQLKKNCATCGNGGECTTCKDDYSLMEDGTCEKCDNFNCAECGDNGKCLSCKEYFSLKADGKCEVTTCHITMKGTGDTSKKLSVTYPACSEGGKLLKTDPKKGYFNGSGKVKSIDQVACYFNLENDDGTVSALTWTQNDDKIENYIVSVETEGDCTQTLLVDEDGCSNTNSDNYVIEGNKKQDLEKIERNNQKNRDDDLLYDTCRLIVAF